MDLTYAVYCNLAMQYVLLQVFCDTQRTQDLTNLVLKVPQEWVVFRRYCHVQLDCQKQTISTRWSYACKHWQHLL
jgi:hypothetical protein